MKALVVDDSRGWVDFHTKNLKEIYGQEFEIDKAYSAKEGYDWVFTYVNNPYDLIITDLHMENAYEDLYAGEWLAEQIKKLSQYKKSQIILCSAAFNIRTIAENLDVDYIPKSLLTQDISIYKSVLKI